MKRLWLYSRVLRELACTHSESLRPKEQRKPEAAVGRREKAAAENRVKCETRGLCTKASGWPNNTGSAKNTQKVD